MSRPLIMRLAVRPLLNGSRVASRPCQAQSLRWLSQTLTRRDESKPPARPNSESLLENIYGRSAARSSAGSVAGAGSSQPNVMASLSQSMVFEALNKTSIDTSSLSTPSSTTTATGKHENLEPYHFHVYSHKHNTHITCTKPNREAIISLSCGNLGFKKSRRKTFDSAYSLAKYVLERLVHNGWPSKIHRLEVTLRGFGQGREAAIKVLLSPEGKVLRDKIVRVSDSTRVKFGGTRSRAQRRL